jgi:hypothetical protein
MLSLVVALVALSGGAAAAQDLARDVKACRLLPDGASRLTCYDAMQLPAEPAAAAVVDPVAKFGQETVRSPSAAPDLKRIESRIPGKFHGWSPNKRLEFENGQVWRIADDSEALYELQSPKVTVHRGLLGAFYLEIEGVPFRVRVVRVC